MRALLPLLILATACGGGDPDAEPDAAVEVTPSVHVVLFTHIEDASPGGALGSAQNEASYFSLAETLTELAERFEERGLPWTLQPDWKLLEAALLYETPDDNFLRALHEDLGVTIDPHSHESSGYNYTDVAYLLDQLGVGGSTVIGGHVWDPLLEQFSAWDRFRVPVAGLTYPRAEWRGDLLIGAGTPGHVNDPLVSGVWRPRDRDAFFVDDPDGNIVAVGSWHDDVAGVEELVAAYADGTVPADELLTASWNIQPATITAPGGIDTIDETVLMPIAALRDEGTVIATDFRSLVTTWEAAGARAYLYQP